MKYHHGFSFDRSFHNQNPMKNPFTYPLTRYCCVIYIAAVLFAFPSSGQDITMKDADQESVRAASGYSTSSYSDADDFTKTTFLPLRKEFKPLPSRTININALGLLQFGPIIQGEYKVAERGYVTPHIRIPYLGLLYHVINWDDRSDEVQVSPAALGIGMGYKYLMPVDKGAWYIGGGAEYSFGSSKGDDGNEWESSFSNVALMSNGGFRWRWPEKNKVLSVGAYIGIYSALRDEWWYVSDPGRTYDERSTTGLFMLELAFGWER